MAFSIWVGDVLDWARKYDGPSFHAALLDPPYELSFMNSKWDGTGISFRPETWAALAAHLLPGGFLMAFGGTRGYHRMACAAEDAGLILHPLIGFCFGSGFPKSTRVRVNGVPLPEWEGHRYGLQALKPALEPIMVAQRPYEGRPVDSITTHGAGALNIEAGRVGTEESTERPSGVNVGIYGRDDRHGMIRGGISGRWPPNLALSHSESCVPLTDGGWRCVDGCAVAAMGMQSGESVSTGGGGPNHAGVSGDSPIYGTFGRRDLPSNVGLGDNGTAARYFPNPSYLLDRLEAEDPYKYTPKAPGWEREAGLDDAALITVGDGRAKSIDNPYQRGETTRLNPHPTVKPLTLTHWLASLLLPPAEYAPRRLLIPFSGASSEMIGAKLAGWEFVQGIEQSSAYAAIGWARLAWWARYYGRDIDAALAAARDRFAATPDAAAGQLALPL